MYGFWRGGYIYTRDVLPVWWLILLFILFLAVYGYIVSHSDKRTGWITHSFAAIGIISLILAIGYSMEAARPVYQWLLRNIPLFSAFRDSQKFVALLCLTYSYLGGLGISVLTAGVTGESIRKMWQNTAIKKISAVGIIAFLVFVLSLPLVYCFTMLGFHNQLQPTDYPAEWYEIKEYLGKDEEDFNILFLPWQKEVSTKTVRKKGLSKYLKYRTARWELPKPLEAMILKHIPWIIPLLPNVNRLRLLSKLESPSGVRTSLLWLSTIQN